MAPLGSVLLAPSPSGEKTYDFMYFLKSAAAGGICCSITHGALTPVDGTSCDVRGGLAAKPQQRTVVADSQQQQPCQYRLPAACLYACYYNTALLCSTRCALLQTLSHFAIPCLIGIFLFLQSHKKWSRPAFSSTPPKYVRITTVTESAPFFSMRIIQSVERCTVVSMSHLVFASSYFPMLFAIPLLYTNTYIYI